MSQETTQSTIKKRFFSGIWTGGIGFLSKTLVLFLTLPFIIRSLGPEGFGVYSLLLSLVELFQFLDFGFTQGLIQQLSAQVAKAETEKSRQTLSVGLSMYVILSGLVLASGIAGHEAIIKFFNIPLQFHKASTIACLLVFQEGSLTLLEGFFGSVLMGHGRYSPINLSQNCFHLISALTTVGLLVCGFDLPLVFGTRLIFAIIRFLFIVTQASLTTEGLWSLAHWNARVLIDLWHVSIFSMGKNFSFLLASHADRFLIAKLCPIEMVGVFTFAYRFLVIPIILVQQLFKGTQFLFSYHHNRKEHVDNQRQFLQVSKAAWFLSASMLLCLVIAYQPLYGIFGDTPALEPVSYTLTTLAIAPICVGSLLYAASNYLFATRQFKTLLSLEMTASAAKIAISFICIHKFGVYGPAIASTVVLIFPGLIIFITCSRLGIPLIKYFQHVIISTLIPLTGLAMILVITIQWGHWNGGISIGITGLAWSAILLLWAANAYPLRVQTLKERCFQFVGRSSLIS